MSINPRLCISDITFSKLEKTPVNVRKTSLEKKIRSGITYRYTCSSIKVTYYGKTSRHFYTRAAEHMGI